MIGGKRVEKRSRADLRPWVRLDRGPGGSCPFHHPLEEMDYPQAQVRPASPFSCFFYPFFNPVSFYRSRKAAKHPFKPFIASPSAFYSAEASSNSRKEQNDRSVRASVMNFFGGEQQQQSPSRERWEERELVRHPFLLLLLFHLFHLLPLTPFLLTCIHTIGRKPFSYHTPPTPPFPIVLPLYRAQSILRSPSVHRRSGLRWRSTPVAYSTTVYWPNSSRAPVRAG